MAIPIVANQSNKSIPDSLSPVKVDNRQDFDYTGLRAELERTPVAAAVSGETVSAGEGAETTAAPASSLKTYRTPQTNEVPPTNEHKTNCGSYALMSECSTGDHHFAKRIVCGREWCPECGENRSAAHNRRISRVLPKAMQISNMGYFVIEFPDFYRKIGQAGVDEIQGWCYSKDALNDTSKRIVEIMAGKRGAGGRGAKRKGGYFSRGLLRWHWFGDENPGKWNPHANLLVDGAFIDPEKLEVIKQSLRQALNVPDLIVNYSYCDNPGQMFHKVEYITRATFRDRAWEEYMSHELFNFRNQRWWGKWDQEPTWGIDSELKSQIDGLLEASKLQGGVCPDCGQPLKTLYCSRVDGHEVKWSQPVDAAWLIVWNAQEIAGTGYYRIPDTEWNNGPVSPGKRLQEMEEQAKTKERVDKTMNKLIYESGLAKVRLHAQRKLELEAEWNDLK